MLKHLRMSHVEYFFETCSDARCQFHNIKVYITYANDNNLYLHIHRLGWEGTCLNTADWRRSICSSWAAIMFLQFGFGLFLRGVCCLGWVLPFWPLTTYESRQSDSIWSSVTRGDPQGSILGPMFPMLNIIKVYCK